MGQCKLCHKSGIFLAINNHGLCPQCANQFALDAKHRMRIIGESAQLVRESKKLEIRLSRLDLLLEHARAMKVYEDIGINLMNPPLSEYLTDWDNYRDHIIAEYLQNEYNEVIDSLSSPTMTTKTKINKITKVMNKVKEYQPKMKNPNNLNCFFEHSDKAIHSIQYDSFIESAKKFEFKGSNTKAIDQYLEALYFLKNDKIDDDLQKDEIEKIEMKISELRGE